ncbi:MAG: alpha/beta hydrolase [Alphaproteobacteria bacterium]|nr:alpha/beta hydrolase [Alphaproteobacteria bacterium]
MVTETLMAIDGHDNSLIWGRLCSVNSRRLIVHVHGLTHNINHLLEVTASEFFPDNGYDHYRIGLYDMLPRSRRLDSVTLADNVSDIQSALNHFRDQYDEIFIAAHSFGGLATLILNPKGVKAISLWDPSLDVTNFWQACGCLTPIPERQEYHLDYGNVFVISEEMVEEIKNYPNQKCLELAALVKTPTQFVIPQQSIFDASPHTSPENYTTAFGGAFDLQKLSGATHILATKSERERVFAATLAWFNQHSAVVSER